jgi:hypothetical protein
MIKITVIILATVMLCCTKKSGKDHPQQEGLIDKWEIRKSVGGISGITNYPPGNGTIFEFKSDNTFVDYQSGNIFQSGTYELKPISGNDSFRLALHSNMRDMSQAVILKGDTLVLLRFEPCCDIPDRTYVRTSR